MVTTATTTNYWTSNTASTASTGTLWIDQTAWVTTTASTQFYIPPPKYPHIRYGDDLHHHYCANPKCVYHLLVKDTTRYLAAAPFKNCWDLPQHAMLDGLPKDMLVEPGQSGQLNLSYHGLPIHTRKRFAVDVDGVELSDWFCHRCDEVVEHSHGYAFLDPDVKRFCNNPLCPAHHYKADPYITVMKLPFGPYQPYYKGDSEYEIPAMKEKLIHRCALPGDFHGKLYLCETCFEVHKLIADL